ncbi:MAG: hypothetical protein RL264_1984 [Bacteroidota bacterium]|jgi:pimeloyl-ACP methyl ester carboxylesterase
MREELIIDKELKLQYFVEGDGEETVICFHGHGRSKDDFEFLIRPNRKWIAVHLYFHGKSFFPDERIETDPLKEEEFISMFQQLLEKEKINNFHLFGFSQGGRFVFVSIPHFEKQIESVTLIAPDGLDNNSFYNRSAHKKWARSLFMAWERNPNRAARVAKVVKFLKVANPKVIAMLEQFVADRSAFKRASRTYRGFRDLKTNEQKLKEIFARRPFPIKIIMGSKDMVIKSQTAKAFGKRTGIYDCVIDVPCGHSFFKEENIALIRPHLFIEA